MMDRALLRTLLAVALLAGCATPQTSERRGLGEAAATGAPVESFTWVGETSPYAYAPSAPLLDALFFEFEVDGSIGFANPSMTHAAPSGTVLEVGVLDERGRVVCAVYAPSPGNACTAPVPANATGARTYRAFVSHAPTDLTPSASAGGVPFRLDVALHVREDLSLGAPPALGPTGFRFRLADVGARGFEPTLGLDADGALFYQAMLKVMRSLDDGRTWEDVTPPLAPPTTFDPMLYVDPWTGRVFSDHLTIACSVLSWSDDKGGTWTMNPMACGLPLDDHQKLAVGSAALPSPLFDGTVYYSFSSIGDLVGGKGGVWVSRSLDGGLTWTSALAMSRAFGVQDLVGGPVVADRLGNVYLPAYLTRVNHLEDGGFGIAVSNDHGLTFEAREVGRGRRIEDVDPGVAIDTEGNAYGAFLDADGVHVVVSTDHGATWTPQRLVSPPALRSFVLGDAVAGDRGRVAIAYVATADTTRGPHEADGWARWHLYLTFTEDALAPEPVWVTTRVSPDDDPVQVGTICQLYVICLTDDRNLGDFLDLQPGPDGRVYIAFVDGCPPGCDTPPDSRAGVGMVAVQEEGPRLFVGRAPWAS